MANILFSVNCELTKKRRQQVLEKGDWNFITKVYTVSDEAFAILIVLNYEHRWRNLVTHPTKNAAKLATDPLYSCPWTSSRKGYSKLPWKSEGIDRYNELLAKIEELRGNPRSGVHLERRIKEDMESKKPKRKRQRMEIASSKPVLGGALRKKLAALKNK